MNPSAIYSKSGKGVQEASGKTSLLKRAERAVLSAIDGRSTLGEVAQKVGKPFDGAFEVLITQLDRDGFIREVAANASVAPAPRPAAPAAKKSAAKSGASPGEDLDFTGIMAVPVQAPKPAADPAAALYKARQEAEARAAEERERLRAEAEAKARVEAEAKARVEAEKKLREETAARARAEAEAKARAAREEAQRMAEAKARLEAEAKARIEAERRAREEAERQAREEAERARREAEELRLRLEEERKAREEAERKAREEAERRAREEAERRAREEAERRAREEAERKAREEAERQAREEAERKAREEAERRAREEAERKAREEAERKAREEAERKARAEQEAQMRRAREEAERKRAEAERRKAKEQARREAGEPEAEPLPEIAQPRSAKPSGEGLDELMADLDSFTQRDDEERKASEQAESRAQEEKQRRLREEGERRERERAERERQEADERRQREEEERRARAEEERRAREEEERERTEMEERARRAVEAFAAQEASGTDDIGVTDSDLDMEDVRRDQAAVPKETRKARQEREREQKRLEKEARQRARAAAKAEARAAKSRAKEDDTASFKVTKVRRRRNWGRPVATALLVLVAAGLGALHVMPIPTDAYQRAASEALRQPVRIGSARLSLWSGIQVNLKDLRIGDATRIASARAYPELAALLGDSHDFKRIELDGVALRQEALGETLLARVKGSRFSVDRIVVKDLKLEGPLPLPLLEADIRLANDGSVRAVQLQGPEELIGQLLPKGEGVDFDLTAAAFALPFAPEISLTSFAMKGRATRYGMRIESWGGAALGGALSGTANVRWGGSWQVDGVLSARGVNAAAFAPALLSEGHAEGTGKFSMSGADPAKLVRAGRVEGSFTIGKGVLGSFDLARAIRTDGREVNGRTQFVEMNGQGTYDRGAVALRNVVIGAGALQAGASADISQSGALSGRIVADVRTASQSLRATLLLGGTVQDPKVRN